MTKNMLELLKAIERWKDIPRNKKWDRSFAETQLVEYYWEVKKEMENNGKA